MDFCILGGRLENPVNCSEIFLLSGAEQQPFPSLNWTWESAWFPSIWLAVCMLSLLHSFLLLASVLVDMLFASLPQFHLANMTAPFIYLVVLCEMWDLSSPTRDQTHATCSPDSKIIFLNWDLLFNFYYIVYNINFSMVLEIC